MSGPALASRLNPGRRAYLDPRPREV
jgi:hypothetical protein